MELADLPIELNIEVPGPVRDLVSNRVVTKEDVYANLWLPHACAHTCKHIQEDGALSGF